jgi:hypothetical protein
MSGDETRDRRPRRVGSRPIEVLAVLLLGIATIGSAFCGYQASAWNGKETEIGRDASDARVESTRLFGLATQRVSYDSVLLSQYAQAVALDEPELQEFYRNTMFRAEFLPVLERFEQQVRDGTAVAGGVLNDQAYLDAEFAEYRVSVQRAEELGAQAEEAGKHGEDYILTTLLLASALFFAGVTTSFRVRFAQLLLLAAAGVLLAAAAMRIADLPIA